jgi:hypothetical protein
MCSFQFLFYGALTAAWLDHRKCLQLIGVKKREFWREAEGECLRFLDGIEKTKKDVGCFSFSKRERAC